MFKVSFIDNNKGIHGKKFYGVASSSWIHLTILLVMSLIVWQKWEREFAGAHVEESNCEESSKIQAVASIQVEYM